MSHLGRIQTQRAKVSKGWKPTRDERHYRRFTSRPYYRRAATAFIQPSMDDRNSLSRLTEREKVCLRQWLQHKSAKEIAADLGISHHAVEKRLKMARMKLGATSSFGRRSDAR